MTKQENQVVYALTECFQFFEQNATYKNAPQHYTNLKDECEKALKLFNAIMRRETDEMAENEIHIVRVLTDCFHFFKRNIVPDTQNANPGDKELVTICEMGLKALGAEVEQENLAINIKYRGKVISPSLKISH